MGELLKKPVLQEVSKADLVRYKASALHEAMQYLAKASELLSRAGHKLPMEEIKKIHESPRKISEGLFQAAQTMYGPTTREEWEDSEVGLMYAEIEQGTQRVINSLLVFLRRDLEAREAKKQQ